MKLVKILLMQQHHLRLWIPILILDTSFPKSYLVVGVFHDSLARGSKSGDRRIPAIHWIYGGRRHTIKNFSEWGGSGSGRVSVSEEEEVPMNGMPGRVAVVRVGVGVIWQVLRTFWYCWYVSKISWEEFDECKCTIRQCYNSTRLAHDLYTTCTRLASGTYKSSIFQDSDAIPIRFFSGVYIKDI